MSTAENLSVAVQTSNASRTYLLDVFRDSRQDRQGDLGVQIKTANDVEGLLRRKNWFWRTAAGGVDAAAIATAGAMAGPVIATGAGVAFVVTLVGVSTTAIACGVTSVANDTRNKKLKRLDVCRNNLSREYEVTERLLKRIEAEGASGIELDEAIRAIDQQFANDNDVASWREYVGAPAFAFSATDQLFDAVVRYHRDVVVTVSALREHLLSGAGEKSFSSVLARGPVSGPSSDLLDRISETLEKLGPTPNVLRKKGSDKDSDVEVDSSALALLGDVHEWGSQLAHLAATPKSIDGTYGLGTEQRRREVRSWGERGYM